MSDILNQNEVDALLAAVEKGEIAAAPAASGAGVQPYDFRRPERVAKDRLRTLTALHEPFARAASACLSGLVRRAVEVRLTTVEPTTWGEFAVTIPSPSCLAVLSAKPLAGQPVLAIDPAIVFPMIDRLLGGSGDVGPPPERPLTDIECRLVQRIAAPLAGLLKEAWGGMQAVDLVVDEIRTSPDLVQAASPHDPAVKVTFDLQMGEASGRMHLCIPCLTIEPALGRFAAPGAAAPDSGTAPAPAERIAKSLAEAPLDVVADLAVTQITVRELLELETGDILKTDAGEDSEATVYVEGIPKFKGKPGRSRRNKAILITRPIEPGKTK